MKVCTRCNLPKALSEFSMDGRWVKGKCKACICELYQERYADNRMIANERRANKKFSELMKLMLKRYYIKQDINKILIRRLLWILGMVLLQKSDLCL